MRVENLGKRFGFEWIFRHLNAHFQPNKRYAIVGANGSGKSTLMKILAGMLLPSEGSIDYNVDKENIFKHIAFAAPYMELIEEFSVLELVQLHCQLKPLRVDIKEFFSAVQFEKVQHRRVSYLSSGMKQKLRIALALFSQAPILLLDEPTTNLDAANAQWFKEQLQSQQQRIIIIASNLSEEIELCSEHICIENFK